MGEFIQTVRDGHLLIVTLNRPEVLNALHSRACHELSDVWDMFVADDELWIAIVTDNGRAFCAGHDLTDNFFEAMPSTGWAGMSRRSDITKPIVAAVNGLAMGGGWEVAMLSDIVIADEHAKFGLTEPRVGFAALGGGASGLPLRMPFHIAMGYALTGNRMDAATAHKWGMVTEVAPSGTVMEVARRYAGDILKCSPHAVRFTKQVAKAALEPEVLEQDIHALSVTLMAKLDKLDDTHEGITAFAEKRTPIWTGR